MRLVKYVALVKKRSDEGDRGDATISLLAAISISFKIENIITKLKFPNVFTVKNNVNSLETIYKFHIADNFLRSYRFILSC